MALFINLIRRIHVCYHNRACLSFLFFLPPNNPPPPPQSLLFSKIQFTVIYMEITHENEEINKVRKLYSPFYWIDID